MSTVVAPWGEAKSVNVAAIERELAALWRQSATGSTAVMRACSWNLVVYAEDDSLERAKALAEIVVELVPSRALIIHHRPKAEGPELDAYVSARCRLLPGGGKMLCTEEITLESRRSGADFLPGLTRALLVPDIPTAVLCIGVPEESVLLNELVAVAERVILDSHGSELETIRHLGPRAIDLAWLRLASWQRALASAFEGQSIGDVKSLEVSVPADAKSEGKWMASWLRAKLRQPPSIDTRDTPRVTFTSAKDARTSVDGTFLSDADVLAAALSPAVLTPAWTAAREALEWTPRQGTSASWTDFTARFVSAAKSAIAERGVFTCALTGGSAVKMYPLLAKEDLDWSRIELYLSDERLVPLESPDSNYRAVREALPMAKIHPVRTALSPEAAADDYAKQLPAQLDVIHLGMGPDGHVASLFAGHALLDERRRTVAAVLDSPKAPARRVTFTLPTFRNAREVWFLIVGETKRAAAKEAREDAHSALPAALVHRAAHKSTWFLDL